ncbi:MAG: hypothetical protein IKJ52_01685 [Muribaculaceae bacterium]|nr:hypothetical protein [Muribaculaceae bacterium]
MKNAAKLRFFLESDKYFSRFFEKKYRTFSAMPRQHCNIVFFEHWAKLPFALLVTLSLSAGKSVFPTAKAKQL